LESVPRHVSALPFGIRSLPGATAF